MGVIDEKVELLQDRLISETIRQWLVLILFGALFVVITSSILTLVKSYRKVIMADCIILLLIQLRIILMMVYDFIYPHQFLLFISDLLHLIILTIIFYIFTKNLLTKKSGFFSMYKVYVTVISGIIVGLFVLGIAQFDQNFRCDKENLNDNYAVYIIQMAEFLLSLLNLVLTIYILREFKHRENQETSPVQRDVIHNVLGTKEDAKVQKYQIKVLAGGLFIYSLIFLILYMLGDMVIYPGDGFECKHSMFFQPKYDYAAIFLFFMNLLSVAAPLLFWYVIYFIPKKLGRLNTAVFSRKKLRIVQNSSIGPIPEHLLEEDIEQITKPLIDTSEHTNGNKINFSDYTNDSKMGDSKYGYLEKDQSHDSNNDISNNITFEEKMKSEFDRSMASPRATERKRNKPCFSSFAPPSAD